MGDVTWDADAPLIPPEAAQNIAAEAERVFGSRAQGGRPASSASVAQGVLDLIAGVSESTAAALDSVLPDAFRPLARQHPTATLAAVILMVIMLLYGVLTALRAPRQRQALILCGPMGAGCTTLFHALQGQRLPNGAVTSMQANVATVDPLQGTKRRVQLVDVPGHPRLRTIFADWSRLAAAIVFVVDAGAFVQQKAATAEQLLDVLLAAAQAAARPPVVVACNKSDLGAAAFDDRFILQQLDKELSTLVATRSVQLGGDRRTVSAGAALGVATGGPFSLDACSLQTHACRISAATGDIAELIACLQAHF